LNPNLFEMANIREQDSWVHKGMPQTATDKAKQLAAMAVAKARRLRPITRNTFEVNRAALVIGGGLAGMTTALSIAEQGYGVFLVERDAQLGGNLRHIRVGISPQDDPQRLLAETSAAVNVHKRISVMLSSEVKDVSGYTGQFRSTIQQADGTELEIQHGAIVVATGGREITPQEYLYGSHPRVVTQRELEQRLADPAFVNDLAGRTITMIQCVGSRQEDHPYCSRVCCTEALKNADRASQRVVILYRDLRLRIPGSPLSTGPPGRRDFPGI
jgi:heterodisulfide reductase subunit A-like polyferredoxin